MRRKRQVPDNQRVKWPDLRPTDPKGFEVQEARAASATPGGKRTRGSGNTPDRPSQKGDVVGALTRAECKTTSKKTLPIERVWLEKITAEACATGLQPAFVFGFDADGRGLCTEDPNDYIGRRRLDWKAYPLDVAERLERVTLAVLAGDYLEAMKHAELVGGTDGDHAG